MKIVVYKDGSKKTVTGEAGKYWLTGEERIRKLSRQIAEVQDLPDPEPEAEPEAQAVAPAPKAKKKTARKKKTEAADGGERGE